jgi:hypothetical protein
VLVDQSRKRIRGVNARLRGARKYGCHQRHSGEYISDK